MREIWRRCVPFIGVLALVLAGCGGDGDAPAESAPKASPPEAAGKDTIKIGGLWAMTGVGQSFGKNSAAVFKMVIDEINAAGGVELADGRRVDLEGEVYDEGCPTP
ncbi:MAG TPA: ABC transporter substrate-binding protein, partial [Acidimicrobiia bacterium]